ncbi:unnamed protein product [Rotaria sordida]|uniref:Uncharacterized protein n=1 Tax=Rotaria sordida TaxID=392033 RepID=A0A814KB40_9BILA|nr:unnamed protein product [Rotaria sordida]
MSEDSRPNFAESDIYIHQQPRCTERNNPAILRGKFPVHEVFEGQRNGASKKPSNRISYTIGSRVLTGDTKVYVVFYGNWSTIQKNIVNTFISQMSNTSWFNIEKTYYYQATPTSPKIYTTGSVILGNTVTDNYTYGNELTDTSVPNIFYDRILSGELPSDPNGNPESCIYSCVAYNYNVSPSGDHGVDGMLNIIAHEIVEAMSDPDVNAWLDSYGNENADKW